MRDAMLQTFTSLHPPSLEQRDQAPPMRVAAQGLAKAIKELPSEGEMDAASPAQNASTVGPPQQPRQQQAAQQAVQQAGAVASSSSGSGASVDGLPSVQNVTWNLADPHRSGVAAQLDGSALREVQSIPSTRDEAVRASVVAMTEPEHLVCGQALPKQGGVCRQRCEPLVFVGLSRPSPLPCCHRWTTTASGRRS